MALTAILSISEGMADILSKSERSYRMSLVRATDTKPEQRVWTIVKRLHVRGVINDRSLPGTPDIVFRRKRKVIFVHGCFWHVHVGCSRTRTPKSNARYWKSKFLSNQSRDRRVARRLRNDGWSVMTVWECQTLDPDRLRRRIVNFLAR